MVLSRCDYQCSEFNGRFHSFVSLFRNIESIFKHNEPSFQILGNVFKDERTNRMVTSTSFNLNFQFQQFLFSWFIVCLLCLSVTIFLLLCLSVCLSPSLCFSVSQFVCLTVCFFLSLYFYIVFMPVCLSVCLSVSIFLLFCL